MLKKLLKVYERSSLLKYLYNESFLSGILHKITQLNIFIIEKTKSFFEFIETIPRLLGINDQRYDKIKQFKDKYKNKRCFILCTGPSLTIEDIVLLKDEYTFGMNSICLIDDKLQWKPDFFAIQDIHVYKRLKDTIISKNYSNVFVPYTYKKYNDTPNNWNFFHLCGSYHIYELRYKMRYFTKFSTDPYVKIYDGYTITYTIIQLAFYMGFKELYLLGADLSYLGNKQHFIDHGNIDPSFRTAAERQLVSYQKAKEYADLLGVKIFNATRGGELEIFPRVNLTELLAVKNQENGKTHD